MSQRRGFHIKSSELMNHVMGVAFAFSHLIFCNLVTFVDSILLEMEGAIGCIFVLCVRSNDSSAILLIESVLIRYECLTRQGLKSNRTKTKSHWNGMLLSVGKLYCKDMIAMKTNRRPHSAFLPLALPSTVASHMYRQFIQSQESHSYAVTSHTGPISPYGTSKVWRFYSGLIMAEYNDLLFDHE